jgi:SAM-dependent methyltransferase
MPKVLNVGGNNRAIPIPPYYAGFEHLLLDIDPRGEPDILCDARELAVREAPGQFDAIYCSHNLEHFHEFDVPKVLKGFHHVLKPEGFAEIRVPDMGALMQRIVAENLDMDAEVYTSPAGPIRVIDIIYGYQKEIEITGQEFYAHRTGFTPRSLTRVLRTHGFDLVVLRKGRTLEIVALAFKQPPTPEQRMLLGLNLEKAKRI